MQYSNTPLKRNRQTTEIKIVQFSDFHVFHDLLLKTENLIIALNAKIERI